MSKELILENLKASLELLEQTHNANTISENWHLYAHIGATLKKVEQTALAPYLMDQVVKLVTIACDKRKGLFEITCGKYKMVTILKVKTSP